MENAGLDDSVINAIVQTYLAYDAVRRDYNELAARKCWKTIDTLGEFLRLNYAADCRKDGHAEKTEF